MKNPISFIKILLIFATLAFPGFYAICEAQSFPSNPLIPGNGNPLTGYRCMPTGLPESRADSLSLPRAQTLYSWQDPGQWEPEIFSTYKYQENNLIDTNVNYYEQGGNPFNRVVYAWDIFDRRIGLTIERYDSAWHNNSNFEYDYDEHGNPTTNLNFIWFSDNWQLTTGSRNSYTYDDRSFLTSIKMENYNVLQYWFNKERSEYIFSDGDFPSEIITYEWAVTEWLPKERIHTIEWKSYDGEHAQGEYISYVLDTFAVEWVSDLRRGYSYGLNGSYDYVEQDYRGDTWINDMKYEEIRDENSMVSEVRFSRWDSGQWEQFEGYRYSYVIEGIDLLEVIAEAWDTITMSYVNQERVIYSDFIHFAGVSEPGGLVYDIKLYPDPAANQLYIDPKGIEFTEIGVLDARGILLLKKKVIPNEIFTIDLSGLSSGLYYLMILKEGNWLGTRKVIKL